MELEPSLPPRTRWDLVLGIWSVPAWIGVVQQLATGAREGRLGAGTEMAASLVVWYSWAAVTPFVLALVRRFPFAAPRRLRAIAIHLLAASAIAVLVTALVVLVERLWPAGDAEPWTLAGYLAQSGRMAARGLLPFWMIYGVVASVGVGLEIRRRYREGELRTARLERHLTASRLAALRMQLQPHFLFNTLHAVTALVERDPRAARKMIVRLSELLRLTLAEDGLPEAVPLAEEIELLERYLDIERVRFGERLRVDYAIAGDAQGLLVPSLLLQPLVENAVRHAVAVVARPVSIEIGARREGESLVVEVSDDGPGLPGGELREGIGLRNARARLATQYGDAARLEVPPGSANGFTVRLRLPAVDASHRDAARPAA